MIFIVTLCSLLLIAVFFFNKAQKTVPIPDDSKFRGLQKNYLIVYFLATFSDWLQGPYVYKLYSDYGYEEEEIAVLYIAGFASSFFFGVIVGYIADKYGRKMLCVSFGISYSLCCLTKLSPEFFLLILGRILGGISTSILLSIFEAWYINEHINHCNLPLEWLNITFSRASFYSGFSAILAGIIAQICAENLHLGSASPFILAIPFLLMSSFLILTTWEEHPSTCTSSQRSFCAPLQQIFIKDPILFLLGLIQSLFDAVMYTFIFSWTPIIAELDPPLGIVFSSFMIAFMIGSKIYSLLLSDRLPPQMILVLASGLSFLSLTIVAVVMNYLLYMVDTGSEARHVLVQVCFVCFVLYEICVGLYIPAMGYLKGRVVPEEHRASITNWFRVPMNILTCISLTLNQISRYGGQDIPSSIIVFKKFHMIYFLCSIMLLIATLASLIFKHKYCKRFSKDESFDKPKDICMETNNVKSVPSS